MVPMLSVEAGIFSGLDISREAVESGELFGNIFGDCLGSIDISEECVYDL